MFRRGGGRERERQTYGEVDLEPLVDDQGDSKPAMEVKGRSVWSPLVWAERVVTDWGDDRIILGTPPLKSALMPSSLVITENALNRPL